MFGIFKSKTAPTALDIAIQAIYGSKPPKKSCNLQEATALATVDLLKERIPFSEVRNVATDLAHGPMPYSTHDLAIATSISFFKNPALRNSLSEIQIPARLQALEWMKERKLAPGILKIFEETLYALYKPTPEASAQENDQTKADRDLAEKFRLFKERNADKSIHQAAKIVCDFMVWQHNFALRETIDDATEERELRAKQIERAFLLGAAGMAADAFSVRSGDEVFFLLNIVGMYHGMERDAAETEVSLIFESEALYESASRTGSSVMVDYLINGKSDRNRINLAALQRRHWKL